MDPRGAVSLVNPQKTGHKLPDDKCHGLTLPTYSRTLLVGGVSSGKTTVANCTVGHCHSWVSFDKIFLMSPNNAETSTGEWGLIDLECLESFPTMEWWAKQPPRCLLILDDISWSLSKKGNPSQASLADRTLGYLASHHGGGKEKDSQGKASGLQIIVCQQNWTMVPPNIRRLMSHFCLFPQRIDRSTVGHIARGVMVEKASLNKCFDFCVKDHDFLLISNIQDGRARVRHNGWRPVLGLL